MVFMMLIVGILYNCIDFRILIMIGICFIVFGLYKMLNLILIILYFYIIFWMMIRYIGILFLIMLIINLGMVIIFKELLGYVFFINNWFC